MQRSRTFASCHRGNSQTFFEHLLSSYCLLECLSFSAICVRSCVYRSPSSLPSKRLVMPATGLRSRTAALWFSQTRSCRSLCLSCARGLKHCKASWRLSRRSLVASKPLQMATRFSESRGSSPTGAPDTPNPLILKLLYPKAKERILSKQKKESKSRHPSLVGILLPGIYFIC